MNIIQVGNPAGVEFIEHLIMDDGVYDRDQLAGYFKEMLIKEPSKCCFLLAVENESPSAFLLAYADDTTNHVFIQQAWADVGTPASVVDNMFYRLVTWTHTIGRELIKIETTRNPKVFERRWNMKLSHYVMEFSIPEDYEKKFHELHNAVIGKESKNERIDINEIHNIGESTASDSSTRELSETSDRTGSGTVPRGSSGTVDSGNATVEGGGGSIPSTRKE